MDTNMIETIQRALREIPGGKFEEEYYEESGTVPLFPKRFTARSTGKGLIQTYSIYPGMEVSFLTLLAESILFSHPANAAVMAVSHCRCGRVGWDMMQNQSVYLGNGDYSIHTMDTCSVSAMSLPSGYYQGIVLHIDLDRLTDCPPELLKGTGITGELLLKKFCMGQMASSFPKDAKAEAIFSGFYDAPAKLKASYFKLKIQELLLWLSQKENVKNSQLTQYQAEQISIVKQIHEELTSHLEQRITIEDLAKQYLMNPTTLKAVFKTVYGNSLAAHIKEHRMEKAAALLLNSNKSILWIARHVGFESQSKFTAAFKAFFQAPPTQYRKLHRR